MGDAEAGAEHAGELKAEISDWNGNGPPSRSPQRLSAGEEKDAEATASAAEAAASPQGDSSPRKPSSGGGMLLSALVRNSSSMSFAGEAKPVKSPRKVKLKKSTDIGLTPVKQCELEVQQQYLHQLHRQYNSKKGVLRAKQKRLAELEAELADTEEKLQETRIRDAEIELHGALGEEQTKELDKLRDMTQRYTTYQRVLQHMLDRLLRNKLVCDCRVEEVKQSIESVRKDLQGHMIRLREAENLERIALADLEKAKRVDEQTRREWEDRLEGRREVMAETNEVLEFRERQLQQKTAIIAEVKGDLDADGEQRLQRKVVTNKIKQLRLANDIAKRTERIDEYEQAFKRIVEATGINNMDQVVNKFLSQEETSSNLKAMIEEATKKISKLTAEKNVHRKEAEQIRFAGIGHTSKQRKLIDDKEACIEGTIKTNKKLQERTEFLQGVLRGIKDGILHISAQLDSANAPVVERPSQDRQSGQSPAPTDPWDLDPTSADTPGGNLSPAQMLASGSTLLNVAAGLGPQTDGEDGAGGGMGSGDGNDADWLNQALAACEQRVLKLLETLPNKELHIDDIDQRLLDRYGHNRVMVNLNRRNKNKAAQASNPFSKKGMKKVLQMSKKPDASTKSRKRMSTVSIARTAAKRQALQDACDKAKAQAHQSEILHEEAMRHFRELKASEQRATPQDLLQAEHKVTLTAEAIQAAQAELREAKTQLEAFDNETARASKRASEEAAHASDDSGSDSLSEDSQDDFDNCVPTIGDKEGRELIKAENKRILRFAEKKRRKFIKNLANQDKAAKGDKSAQIERDVVEATKQEARKISVVRASHHTRLTYIKKNRGAA